MAESEVHPGGELEGEIRRGLNQLAILCLLDAESSVDELARRLAALGLEVDEGTLYPILRRLEQRGLLRSRWDSTGERPRRCYLVTEEGRGGRLGLAALGKGLRGALDCLVGGATGAPTEAESGALAAERAALQVEREEVERMRNDLLSTVSHELRTPLTLVRTSVGLLLDSDPEPEMRERLLRNIHQSADRMHVLVTDILDLVRLRAGKAELQLRYLDVGDLVAEAVGLMRPLLDQKEQNIERAALRRAPRILGDRRRLEQVLLNLLSNANKFAPAGARIRVSIADEGASVTLAVADDGPGIAPEAQAYLFEQFYTAQTSSPSHNIGAGLGLPIAKSIVEAHGGSIRVESVVGQGTTVYVTLPKEGPARREDVDEDTGG